MKKLIFLLVPVLVIAFNLQAEVLSMPWHGYQVQKDSVKAQIGRANSLLSQGKKEDASKICTGIMKSDPDNKDAVRLWLMSNMEPTPTAEDEAIKSLEKLEKEYSGSTAILFWKSFLMAEKGRNEEALAGFEKLTTLQPDSSVNWVGKGQILQAMGRFEEAFKSFDRATTLDPKRFDVWGMKAESLAKLGRLDEAITSVSKALEIAPDYPVNIYNRACFYSLKGDKANALADLKKAFSLNPSFKEYATKDEDLKSLWEDEEFKKLTL